MEYNFVNEKIIDGIVYRAFRNDENPNDCYVDKDGKKIKVTKVFNDGIPAVSRFFDPYAISAMGTLNLIDEFGDGARQLEWPSAREIAEAAVKAMQDEAAELMKHESVKQAYEHFLLMCELTKEHK